VRLCNNTVKFSNTKCFTNSNAISLVIPLRFIKGCNEYTAILTTFPIGAIELDNEDIRITVMSGAGLLLIGYIIDDYYYLTIPADRFYITDKCEVVIEFEAFNFQYEARPIYCSTCPPLCKQFKWLLAVYDDIDPEPPVTPIAHADAIRNINVNVILPQGGIVEFDYTELITSTGFAGYPSPGTQYTIETAGIYHFRFTLVGQQIDDSAPPIIIPGPLLFGLRIFSPSGSVPPQYTFRSMTEDSIEDSPPTPLLKTIYGAGIIRLNAGDGVSVINLGTNSVRLVNDASGTSTLNGNSATFSLRLIDPL